MNCLELTPQTETVVQGQDLSLNVRLVTADPGDPFDLTSASEIVAVFASTQAPLYIEKKLSMSQITIASAAGGRFLVLLSPADTNLFPINAQASFEVRVTIAGKITTIQFLNALNVVASLFPTAP